MTGLLKNTQILTFFRVGIDLGLICPSWGTVKMRFVFPGLYSTYLRWIPGTLLCYISLLSGWWKTWYYCWTAIQFGMYCSMSGDSFWPLVWMGNCFRMVERKKDLDIPTIPTYKSFSYSGILFSLCSHGPQPPSCPRQHCWSQADPEKNCHGPVFPCIHEIKNLFPVWQ